MAIRIVLTPLLLLLFCSLSHSEDSLQFRGAARTGIFEASGLLHSWPEEGPPIAWVATGFGVGYSSALVGGGNIYVTGTLEEQDSYVFILDMDGREKARIFYGKETTAESAPGARSTPTIVGDRLYLLSGLGEVSAIDLTAQRVLWQVNILERFNAPNNQWHLSEALLVDGDKVICTPGGPDAVMAALDTATGDTVWVTEGMDDMASHVAPLLAVHNGRHIVLTETSKYLICVDADSGELLWKHEHLTEWNIHGVTPIYHEGCVYYVAGYKSGGGQLRLSDDASSYTVNWMDTELDCQHHGVVLVDGYLYGTSHHRGGGQLVCLDWDTGEVMWTDKDIRQAVVVYADGMLYTYEGSRSGIVSLVKPSPSGLERTGQVVVTAGSREHWAHPTIAFGRLYIRRGDALICYDITRD